MVDAYEEVSLVYREWKEAIKFNIGIGEMGNAEVEGRDGGLGVLVNFSS